MLNLNGGIFCDEETFSGEICNASGMDSIIRKNRAARHIWIIFWFEEVPFFYNYNTKTNVTLFFYQLGSFLQSDFTKLPFFSLSEEQLI